MRVAAALHIIRALATVSLLAVSGCQSQVEVRYRVIVEVDESGTTRSGQAVWSWSLAEAQLALASPYDGKFVGEAVRVPLANGNAVFALLRGQDGNENTPLLLPERLFGNIGRDSRGEPLQHGGDRIKDVRDIASRVGEKRTLDCAAKSGDCLMLVTFRDMADPMSIEEVDPRNPSSALGPNVGRIRMSVQITDAPVAVGAAGTLPNPKYKGFFNWDGKLPFDQRSAIGTWHFKQNTGAD